MSNVSKSLLTSIFITSLSSDNLLHTAHLLHNALCLIMYLSLAGEAKYMELCRNVKKTTTTKNLTLRVASCPPDHGCPPRLRHWAGLGVIHDFEAVREWAEPAGHVVG